MTNLQQKMADIYYTCCSLSSSSVNSSCESTIDYVACFQEVPPSKFLMSIEEDLTYDNEHLSEVLTKSISEKYLFYETGSNKFFKFFDKVKAQEFAKYAIEKSLSDGAVFKEIDWKFNFLTPKELVDKMFMKFLVDMQHCKFSEVFEQHIS